MEKKFAAAKAGSQRPDVENQSEVETSFPANSSGGEQARLR
jgi:hypothetical protein